jgi:hypothetical protein
MMRALVLPDAHRLVNIRSYEIISLTALKLTSRVTDA